MAGKAARLLNIYTRAPSTKRESNRSDREPLWQCPGAHQGEKGGPSLATKRSLFSYLRIQILFQNEDIGHFCLATLYIDP